MGRNFLTDDPAAQGRYRAHQDALIGPDPLAERAFPWPDLPDFIDSRHARVRGWRMWGIADTRDGPRLVAPYRPDPTYPAALWVPGTTPPALLPAPATSGRARIRKPVLPARLLPLRAGPLLRRVRDDRHLLALHRRRPRTRPLASWTRQP